MTEDTDEEPSNPSSNVMLLFAHFCEVHGPSCVLCCQSVSSMMPASEYGSMSRTGTCASCQLIFPKDIAGSAPRFLRTSSEDKSSMYVSTQYPKSQQRFTAVRQACLRALSSEHTFNDHTPMMFSDGGIGTAIVLSFRVSDGSSRGQVRRYALIFLGQDEAQVASYWNTVVPHMEELARSIKLRALIESDKEDSKRYGNERFLRIRDSHQSSKSLVTILKDDKLFVEIHAKFSRVLAILDRIG
uniref:ARAD1D43604p n=1 Tax=Blastobotrys adeninivorans TaxID=409370 RepID=A0A060TCL5_BLAAD